MDFTDTFSMGPAFESGSLHADIEDDFPDAIKLISGEIGTNGPLRFTREKGRKHTDLVSTTLALFVLISERAVNVMRDFSGWQTLPVQFFQDDGTPIEDYRFLVVTGRCGPIDKSRSRPVDRIVPTHREGHMRVWQGLFFDPETWDGSDVFRPAGTGYIFVVGEVKRRLEAAGLSNLKFEALSEFERLSP